MNKIFLNNIGDLGEAQRASYYRFLSKGISEELLNFPNPFISKIKVPTRTQKRALSCLVYLYTNEIKLKGPTFSIDLSLRRDTSYAIQFYVPGEYSYNFDEKLDIKRTEDFFPIDGATTIDSNIFYNDLKQTIKKIRIKQDIFLVKFL